MHTKNLHLNTKKFQKMHPKNTKNEKNSKKMHPKNTKKWKKHTEIAKITPKMPKNDISGITDILPGLSPIGYPR